MSCPGLHCPGCTGGQSLAITGGAVLGLVLAAETVQWIAERVFWIGGTMAACLALSVAASMWLEARADLRGRAWGAARGIYSRADVVLPEPALPMTLTATEVPPVTAAPEPPAIEHHHYGPQIHVYPGAGEAAARIIRQALGGQSGEAITEGSEKS